MTGPAASPFSARGVLVLLFVGFCALVAILYFIAIGDTGLENSQNGRAHAAAKGLNGYSALVELVEADGFAVSRSREKSELETGDILVLTPPHNANAEDLAEVIETRRYLGPTLVILPKWTAFPSRFVDQLEDPEGVEDGWVLLAGTNVPQWANQDEGLFALNVSAGKDSETKGVFEPLSQAQGQDASAAPLHTFATLGDIQGITGDLPSPTIAFAVPDQPHTALIVDQNNRVLAFSMGAQTIDALESSDAELAEETQSEERNWVVFVIEPDLMNNWGLAEPDRALAALSIVRLMSDGFYDRVVFDLTLNGFGGAMNLLTLAFQPPFLAATMCLALALLALGWRAFLRFGPPAAPERETAFGKAGLVTNGADLILRAGRLNLLAEPYIKLSEQRLKGAAALSPDDPASAPLAAPAHDLRQASKPADIVRAARALYDKSQDIQSNQKEA